MIDWNSSTIPQAFSGYVPFMSGSRILKNKRGEKTFDAAVYAFGTKTADERDNILFRLFIHYSAGRTYYLYFAFILRFKRDIYMSLLKCIRLGQKREMFALRDIILSLSDRYDA